MHCQGNMVRKMKGQKVIKYYNNNMVQQSMRKVVIERHDRMKHYKQYPESQREKKQHKENDNNHYKYTNNNIHNHSDNDQFIIYSIDNDTK